MKEMITGGSDKQQRDDMEKLRRDGTDKPQSGDTLRVADIINESIVDGPGLRLVIFTQGCARMCPGCHNPKTHLPDGGHDVSIGDILLRVKHNPLLRGLTFSGGEPFLQAGPLSRVAKAVKENGLDIVTYTGYTYEELLSGANDSNNWLDLLWNTDILVDGPYVENLRTLDVPFIGSKNQRAIDIKLSMARGEIVLYKFGG